MIDIKLKGTEEINKIDAETYSKNHFKSIIETIRLDIERNIEQERITTSDIGGSYGTPKPLTLKYLNWKIKHGKPRNIFRKDLNLIKSVKIKKNSDFNYTIFIGGIADKYASFVNEKRKFFGISKSIIDFIENDFKMKKVG